MINPSARGWKLSKKKNQKDFLYQRIVQFWVASIPSYELQFTRTIGAPIVRVFSVAALLILIISSLAIVYKTQEIKQHVRSLSLNLRVNINLCKLSHSKN